MELNMKTLRTVLLKNIQPLLNKVSNTALWERAERVLNNKEDKNKTAPNTAAVPQGKQDSALIAKNGGIDLNARNMGLEVAHDGKGIEMNFDPAMVSEFQKGNFTGVEGIILRIIPIRSPLPILGLKEILGHIEFFREGGQSP